MTYAGIIPILLILLNIAVSYKGFSNQQFFDGYKFQVDQVLIKHDYKRIFTGAFLHANWTHLLLNILSLWFFSDGILLYLGAVAYLVIYFGSILGSKLFTLLVHRQHGDYSSIGASGAVSGIIFASIAVFPGMSIGLFIISLPAWLYGILYVAFSIYGVRSKRDNIGHESHLGGALMGMVLALLFRPSALYENSLTILLLAVPIVIFICLIYLRPQTLLVENLFYKTHPDHYSIDHRYNLEKTNRKKEIDRILDKINRSGINSLSKKERELLEEHSKHI